MKVTITSQLQAYAHKLEARTHSLISDVPPDLKGQDAGPTPHELFLLSLGTCTAMTLEMYALRQAMTITKITVTVSETKIDDPDQAGTMIPHIVEDIDIEGNLTAAQLTQLHKIAKSCPVYKLVVGKKVIDANLKSTAPAATV